MNNNSEPDSGLKETDYSSSLKDTSEEVLNKIKADIRASMKSSFKKKLKLRLESGVIREEKNNEFEEEILVQVQPRT